MKAVVVYDNEATFQPDHPLPKLRDDYVLIKTAAVALNPTDWKHVYRNLVCDGCLIGCDFSGTIEAIGRAVSRKWTVGDRVAGVTHGGNCAQLEDGAFAEYIVAKGDVLVGLPADMAFEEASTICLGAATVMQGLYQKGLRMNLPSNPVTAQTYILIHGGSTATGALGVQFAKLSGYTVLATCSSKNFDYVRSLGADAVFDYNDVYLGRSIREFTKNTLKLAWDIMGTNVSAEMCAEALSTSTGCRYASFLANRCPRTDVASVGTNMYTIYGEQFEVGSLDYPASQEDYEWAKMFMAMTEQLLAEGKLKPHKWSLQADGLKGILKGLEDMKDGQARGEKLVYRVADSA